MSGTFHTRDSPRVFPTLLALLAAHKRSKADEVRANGPNPRKSYAITSLARCGCPACGDGRRKARRTGQGTKTDSPQVSGGVVRGPIFRSSAGTWMLLSARGRARRSSRRLSAGPRRYPSRGSWGAPMATPSGARGCPCAKRGVGGCNMQKVRNAFQRLSDVEAHAWSGYRFISSDPSGDTESGRTCKASCKVESRILHGPTLRKNHPASAYNRSEWRHAWQERFGWKSP